MYRCESWTITKAECWKLDAFELWCWRRLLRVPWTARRSNQSILKISPGCSLEGLMLKLKLQYFGHPMQRADSLEKTLMLGKIEGRRRRGRQRMSWLDGIRDSMDMGLSKLSEIVPEREAWRVAVRGGAESGTWPRGWACTCSWGRVGVGGPGGGEITERWVRAGERTTRRQEQVDKGLTGYSPMYIIGYSVLSQWQWTCEKYSGCYRYFRFKQKYFDEGGYSTPGKDDWSLTQDSNWNGKKEINPTPIFLPQEGGSPVDCSLSSS